MTHFFIQPLRHPRSLGGHAEAGVTVMGALQGNSLLGLTAFTLG